MLDLGRINVPGVGLKGLKSPNSNLRAACRRNLWAAIIKDGFMPAYVTPQFPF